MNTAGPNGADSSSRIPVRNVAERHDRLFNTPMEVPMKLTPLSAAVILALGLTAGAPAQAQSTKSDSATARSAQTDTRSAAAGQSSASRPDEEPAKPEQDWSW